MLEQVAHLGRHAGEFATVKLGMIGGKGAVYGEIEKYMFSTLWCEAACFEFEYTFI